MAKKSSHSPRVESRLASTVQSEELAQTAALADCQAGSTIHGTFCFVCKKNFSNNFALKRHLESFHVVPVPRSYTCDYKGCGKQFTRRDIRDRHYAATHGFAKLLCPNCGKFVRKDGLGEHLSTSLCQRRALAAYMKAATQEDELCTAAVTETQNACDNSGNQAQDSTLNCNQEVSDFSNKHTPKIFVTQFIRSWTPEAPELVPDSPMRICDDPYADPLLTNELEEMDELIADVPGLQDVVWPISTRNLTYRSASGHREIQSEAIDELITVDKTACKFYVHGARQACQGMKDMKFGKKCALCSGSIGDTPQSVFQHAKSHVRSYILPSFQCTSCGIKFLYQQDRQLHEKLAGQYQGWCISVQTYDEDDWVAHEDGLRRWEALQLQWYLAKVDKFLREDAQSRKGCSAHSDRGSLARRPNTHSALLVTNSDGALSQMGDIDMAAIISRFEQVAAVEGSDCRIETGHT